MRENSFKTNYYGIFIITALLLLVGLFMVLSASSACSEHHEIYFYFKKQLIGVLIGVCLLFFSSRLDYRNWRFFSFPLLIASIVLLFFVFVPGIGQIRGGACRWIDIGFISFQPSEFSKLALILFGADLLARKRARKDIKKYIPLVVATVLICLLLCLQPDFSTAVVVATVFLGMLFVGGLELRRWITLTLVVALIATLLLALGGYRLTRVMTFFNPEVDPEGAGYQIRQSLYAFGSGGIFGKGFGKSRQKFFYLYASHTDFIFAVLGEEMGLVGASMVVLLYFLFGYFGLRTAIGASDYFGRVVAAGICIWVVVQAFINIAAATHTIPVTGIPLPLISYGGSSLIFTIWGIGILLSIAKGEKGVKIESTDNWGWHRRSRISRHLRAE